MSYELLMENQVFINGGPAELATNILNNNSYIGSSSDLARRIQEYFTTTRLKAELNRGESIIHRALLKYDYKNFTLEIIEVIDSIGLSRSELRSKLLEREQYYIDLLKPEYNIRNIAGNNLGAVMSPATREKMSKAKTGFPSHRKGKKGIEAFSDESRSKMSMNSAMNKPVFVYNKEHVLLFPPFSNISKCALFLGISRFRIGRALDTGKIVENKYIFTSSINTEWDNTLL